MFEREYNQMNKSEHMKNRVKQIKKLAGKGFMTPTKNIVISLS
jgi:hypothetical protein